MKTKALLLGLMIAANGFAQGVIDVHSHIITPEFVSSLENEGRLMDEGFPLPKYNVENHLKWMDEAGVETSVLTLAAPQPSSAEVVRQTNEAAARIKREHPGRFLFCAALPLPDVSKAIEEAKYAYVAPQVLTQSLARMKDYLSKKPDLAPFREMILYQNANQIFK